MLRHLRTPWPGLVGLALASLTLLPPDGWALCVAPGGHIELEPLALDGAAGCCTAPAPLSGDDVTSADSDCESCSDVVAFSGSVLPCRPLHVDVPSVLAPAVLVSLAAPYEYGTSAVRATALAPSPPGTLRTGTLLRN